MCGDPVWWPPWGRPVWWSIIRLGVNYCLLISRVSEMAPNVVVSKSPDWWSIPMARPGGNNLYTLRFGKASGPTKNTSQGLRPIYNRNIIVFDEGPNKVNICTLKQIKTHLTRQSKCNCFCVCICVWKTWSWSGCVWISLHFVGSIFICNNTL